MLEITVDASIGSNNKKLSGLAIVVNNGVNVIDVQFKCIEFCDGSDKLETRAILMACEYAASMKLKDVKIYCDNASVCYKLGILLEGMYNDKLERWAVSAGWPRKAMLSGPYEDMNIQIVHRGRSSSAFNIVADRFSRWVYSEDIYYDQCKQSLGAIQNNWQSNYRMSKAITKRVVKTLIAYRDSAVAKRTECRTRPVLSYMHTENLCHDFFVNQIVESKLAVMFA